MRALYVGLLVAATVLILTPIARADWKEGMPFKMHYPQLPDPMGWDVRATPPLFLADDFKCTQTGPITDVHLWGSYRGDLVGPIANIHLSIHDNDVTGLFSKPGKELWSRDFSPNEFIILPWGGGDQGWLDPMLPSQPIPGDHKGIYQVNITGIRDPFVQREGNIYWLDLQVISLDSQFGWKTSLSPHFMDDAVYGIVPAGGPGPVIEWLPLEDPRTGASLDLAFVITPEPATLCLLGAGVVGLLARRRGK
jgi:hypothetical protein